MVAFAFMKSYVRFPFVVMLIIVFALVLFEGVLRKGTDPKATKDFSHDKGTTSFVVIAFVISWIAILLSIVFNRLQIGALKPHVAFNIVGLMVMFFGIVLRTVAARTLGRFYTRTLETESDQHVISSGIYRHIRHPGYLGNILLFIFAGISTSNLLTILVIMAVIVPAYARRIRTEEEMLRHIFGKEYEEYTVRSKKLIPYLY